MRSELGSYDGMLCMAGVLVSHAIYICGWTPRSLFCLFWVDTIAQETLDIIICLPFCSILIFVCLVQAVWLPSLS